MEKTFSELEKTRLDWSVEVFKEATAFSSLDKLKDEIKEVESLLGEGYYPEKEQDLTEEYADCLMCLFDSAGRVKITPEMIRQAFEKKLEKNIKRLWIKNPNNTYSHVQLLVPSNRKVYPKNELGEGVTQEWFITYHSEDTPWIKDKILLHADTGQEVLDSFVQKFPDKKPELVEYYGIYY